MYVTLLRSIKSLTLFNMLMILSLHERLKTILRCFKLASNLQVNFFKSCIMGVNVLGGVSWFDCKFSPL